MSTAAASSESPGMGLSLSLPGTGGTGSRSPAPGLGLSLPGPGCTGPRSPPPAPPRLLRLSAVPGCEAHRVNDLLLLSPAGAEPPSCGDVLLQSPAGAAPPTCGSILLQSPAEAEPPPCGSGSEAPGDGNERHVVFFPGDIQNFQQEMALQPEGAQFQSWSLERVALILGRRFPGRYVWVVRASCMYLHKFSCYHNFVESNMFGAPKHSPDYGALRHLRALLSHGMERAGLRAPGAAAAPFPPGFSLALVAFSKGCVVLNQMVYELEGAAADPGLARFLGSVTDMYWLDGGHPGGSETWVTDRRALRRLAACGAALHAHVTPYEVRDPMRAWVGREHRRFVRTLEELGARLTSTLHFEDEAPSINNHFRVIQTF